MSRLPRWALVLCGLGAAVGAIYAFGPAISQVLSGAVQAVASLGPAGMALYFLLYVATSLALLPASAMTLAAGAVWGFGAGLALVWASASAAAAAAFWAGRRFARGWIAKKLAGNARFEAVDRAVEREGVKIVALTRLSPVFPFVLLNYAFGLTRIGFGGYFWASVFGMLPGTMAFVYLGALAGDVARAGAGQAGETPPWLWALRVAGLAATALVAYLAGKIAKEALAKKI